MPLVFMSYAGGDDDAYLGRFFADLVSLIAGKIGRKTEIAYRAGQNLKLGDAIPEELASAASTAKVMLCVFSPSYFSDDRCGREYALFASRVDAYQKAAALEDAPPLIVPIVWFAERKGARFPAIARALIANQGFGDLYEKQGLQAVIRLGARHEEEYQEILTKLSDQIIEVSDAHALPDLDPAPALADIQNAFAASGAKPEEPRRAGARHVRFQIVAAVRDEIASLRADVTAYRSAPAEWRPYLPLDVPIELLLKLVAAEEGFSSEIVPIKLGPVESASLVDKVKRAREENVIVVIVVDPWTIRIEAYHDVMAPFAELDFRNTAFLFATNHEDPETRTAESVLEVAIRATFEAKAIAGDPKTFHVGIQGYEDFKQRLRTALIELQKRILETAEIKRRAEAGRIFVKPVISAVRP